MNNAKNLLLKMLVTCVCTAAFLLICQVTGSHAYASGTTYYVDQNDPYASDSNPGTEALPWLTITKAADTLEPGDTVYVKEGVYREFVRPENSGTEGNPITYEVYPGDTVVITGAEVVSGWTLDTGYIYKKTSFDPETQYDNPIVLSTAVLPSNAYLINNDIQMVIQEDGVYDAVVLDKVESKNEMTTGTFYMDVGNETLYVWLTDNSNPNNGTIQVGVRNFIFLTTHADGTNRDYLIIKGFQMRYNNMQICPWPWSGLAANGDHITIENNIVTWCSQQGGYLSGDYNVAKNNVFSYNGFDGFNVSRGEYVLIDGNRTEHNNLFHWSPNFQGGGGKYTGLSNSIIRNHTSAYNLGPGLWFDIDVINCVIENSCFHDNIGPGIMNEISHDNTIRNNMVYRNNCAADVPVKVPVFDGNLITGTTDTEWDIIGYGIYNSSSPGTYIYNNTVVQNGYDYGTTGVSSGGIYVIGLLRGDASTHDVTVKNNIIVNNGQVQLEINQNNYDAYTYGNVSDYNLIYQDNGSYLAYLAGTSTYYSTLASWYSASGYDENSISQDPLFASEGNYFYDFYLNQSSPAIDAGDDLTDVLYDYDWTIRELGDGYDMGAYEFDDGITLVNPDDEDVTTVLNETGSNGSVQISDYRVVLPDAGDKVSITFSVPSDGYYILDVNERSGYYDTGTGTAYKDCYWSSGAYEYVLDNQYRFDLTGDVDSVGENYSTELWGIAKTAVPVFLTSGSHTMTLEADTDWMMFGYLALKPVPGKGVIPYGNTTVLNDTGTNGNVEILNYKVILPDVGDKVRITFTVDNDGYYYIQMYERSGITSVGQTCYWDDSAYKYVLDSRTTIKRTGDVNTTWNRTGIEDWGLANEDNAVFLAAGTHTITFELMVGTWGMLGYIGIWQAPGKAVNPYGNTTVLNETGAWGSVDIGSWRLVLPDKGDKVKIDFTVDSDGFYTIDARLRSGTIGSCYSDCYYWSNGGYTFNIDDTTPVTLEGDMSTIGPLYSTYEYWGMARTDVPVYLTAGSHYITMESTKDNWIMLAHLGINLTDSVRIPAFHEAEELTVNAISSGDTHTITSSIYLSGGYGDYFDDNATNDYIEYQVNVPVTGTYNIKVRMNTNNNRGIFQLAVDGTNQGSAQDNYSSTSEYVEFNLGKVKFTTTGDHLFRFTITGKNASSSAYKILVDYIRLTKT